MRRSGRSRSVRQAAPKSSGGADCSVRPARTGRIAGTAPSASTDVAAIVACHGISASPPAANSSALNTAAATAAAAIRRRGSSRSGRLSTAEATLPAIKPTCTAITSHAAPAAVSAHSRLSAGTTAVR